MSAFSFGVAEYSRELAGRELPVTFFSAGEQLVGMLHLPAQLEREDCPGVVLLHGYTGTKVEPHRIFVKTARRLAETGMVVLRFDFWGVGGQRGRFQRDDHQPGVGRRPRRSGRSGTAGGGGPEPSGGARFEPRRRNRFDAGRNGRARPLAGALGAGLLRPAGADPQLGRPLGEPARPHGACVEMGGFVLKEAFFRDLVAWGERHLSIAMKYTGPVLIVHGSADEVVPVVYGQRYAEHYARRPGHPRVELEIVPEADHTFNRTDWERQAIERSVAFFADTLR